MYPLDSIGILIHQQLISSLDQNPSIQFRSEIMDRPEHLPEPAVLPATDPGRSWGNKEMREAEDRYDTCRVTLYINNNTNIKQHYYIRIHDIIYMYIYYIVSMMYISDIFPAWYRTLLMLYRCSATRHLAPIETTGGNPKWVCLKIWHPTESTGLSSLVITFFHFPITLKYVDVCWRDHLDGGPCSKRPIPSLAPKPRSWCCPTSLPVLEAQWEARAEAQHFSMIQKVFIIIHQWTNDNLIYFSIIGP